MAVVPGRARGLPIGNLLSQHFGNLMLGVLDHVVKEQIGVAGYVRYMDDMLFFGEDKKNLARQVAQATSFLRKELLLEPHPVVINRTRYGIPFLSYRITDNGLRLSQRAKQRFRKKIKVACKLKDAERGLALLSFIERANCEGFKRKVFYGDVL
jgi:RNA-directed DNA polymerase